MDVGKALQNVVGQLQGDPTRYKAFGVYWWPVKKLLIGAGYTRDNLAMLGEYQDPETAALVPSGDLQSTLEAAFETYGVNIRYPHPGGFVETPDGEMVLIYDEDAGV